MIGNKPNTINSGGRASTTLPDVFLGSLSDTLPLSDLLDTVNLTVEKGTIPVLFVTGVPSKGSQSVARRYLWKLGAGEFNPIGGENIESKLELIEETFLSKAHIDTVLSSENAQEITLGVIADDFILYMNNKGTYALTNVDKTYIITFTKDDIDYAYIFQGTLGTYGVGNLQFVADDFVFIYQSDNQGRVNDFLEFANLSAFPITGETGKIYLALDSNNIYRWSGSVYVKISDSGKLNKDISTYTPATNPLSGTEKALIHDGIDFKEVSVSEFIYKTDGKSYESLSVAMSVIPLPENNTIFYIDESNLTERGMYAYDSSEVSGYRFVRDYSPNGIVEQGNTQAVSGGEVFSFVDDKMTTLRSVLVDSIFSKNLVYKIFDGVYINSTVDNGGYRVGAGWNMAVFEVEEGKTYTISGWNSSRKEIGIFSSTPPITITSDSSVGVIKSRSATYVFGYDKVNGKITFTAPSGAKWVGFTVASSSEADTLFEEVQAEEGITNTGYMPYGQVIYVPKKELINDFDLQILKNGDTISVRSKFNSQLDSVIQLSLNNSQNGASNLLNVTLIGNTLPITATPTNYVQNNGDAVPPPFQIRSGDTSSYLNIAGNHGLGSITDATATAHGKTSSDLLSVWTDGTGWEWYLVDILSADSLRFASKPKNVSGLDKIKRTPASPLTHVSGAVNTSNISFTGSSYEYKPAINTISVKMYLDGVEITADGTYMGNEFKVIDTHNVVDPTQPTLTIPYLPQNNGTMVKNTLIHTFHGNSIYTSENIADWRKNHLLTNQGIIQPQVLLKQSFSSVMTYGMNVGTVGSIDFTNGFDISALSTNTYVNVSQLKDTTKSVQQLSQILMQGSSPQIGGGFGFNPLVGLGKSESLLQNTEHMMISSAKKYYPRAYNGRNSETKILRGIGYFAFWDATINPKLSADYYVPHGNQDLYFINIRVAMTKEKVYLAAKLLNREFEIVHKSSGLTLHTEDATTSEGLIVSGAVGEWAVLKIR